MSQGRTLQTFDGVTGKYSIHSQYDDVVLYKGRTTPDAKGMAQVSQLTEAIRKAEVVAFEYAKSVIYGRVDQAIREVRP